MAEGRRSRGDPAESGRPWDLGLRGPTVVKINSNKAVNIVGKLENTGRGPIIGVQLLVVIYSANHPNLEPVRESPLRGVTVQPGIRGVVLPEDPKVKSITIALPAYLENEQLLTVLIKAIGLAPPTTLTEVERRIIVS